MAVRTDITTASMIFSLYIINIAFSLYIIKIDGCKGGINILFLQVNKRKFTLLADGNSTNIFFKSRSVRWLLLFPSVLKFQVCNSQD